MTSEPLFQAPLVRTRKYLHHSNISPVAIFAEHGIS